MTTATLLMCTFLLGAPTTPRKQASTTSYSNPTLTRYFKGKTVLFVGDSMIVTGLEIWARHWVKKNGGTYRRYHLSNSTTATWARSRALQYALKKYKPHMVFVVLGSNELYIDKPKSRARYIRKILKKLGKYPYRWIGPPRWARDTEFIRVLARTIPKGRFYPFNGRRIGRAKDGRHPSVMGSKVWVKDIFTWYVSRLLKEGRL